MTLLEVLAPVQQTDPQQIPGANLTKNPPLLSLLRKHTGHYPSFQKTQFDSSLHSRDEAQLDRREEPVVSYWLVDTVKGFHHSKAGVLSTRGYTAFDTNSESRDNLLFALLVRSGWEKKHSLTRMNGGQLEAGHCRGVQIYSRAISSIFHSKSTVEDRFHVGFCSKSASSSRGLYTRSKNRAARTRTVHRLTILRLNLSKSKYESMKQDLGEFFPVERVQKTFRKRAQSSCQSTSPVPSLEEASTAQRAMR